MMQDNKKRIKSSHLEGENVVNVLLEKIIKSEFNGL